MTGRVSRAVLVALAVLLPGLTLAAPVDGTSRIAVQAGWNYVPNARFVGQAAESGFPLTRASPGGPSVLGVFGYRPLDRLEVSIELGYTYEQFAFAGGQTMTVNRMPVMVTSRYALLVGELFPYVGGGGGYFLNFVSGGPKGGLESHGAGPVFLAGVSLDLTERVSVLAEYRLAFARVALPEVGFFNVGGNFLMLGIQYGFPPEDRGGRP